MHATPQPVRPFLIPSNTLANSSDPVMPSFLAMPEERQPQKKSTSVVLTVILLAIIGYASYRVWPPLLDIWQRMRQPAEATEPPVKASSVTPASTSVTPASSVTPMANSATPETKSDDSVRPAEPDQKAASLAAEENAAPAATPSPLPPAKSAEAVAPPAAAEIFAPKRKPAGPFATSAANSLK